MPANGLLPPYGTSITVCIPSASFTNKVQTIWVEYWQEKIETNMIFVTEHITDKKNANNIENDLNCEKTTLPSLAPHAFQAL